MEPTMLHGDGLIAIRGGRARPGQRRVFEHPHRPGTWLVKRVDALRPDDKMWVVSDNPDVTRADSRTFGSIPIAGSYRVLVRIPARLLGTGDATPPRPTE